MALFDDHGLQALTELLVLDAEDRDVGDVVVAVQQILDLGREDVLAAADDHVVVAAVDEQPGRRVEVADVAAGEQAVDSSLCRRRLALELDVVADEDPPGPAARHGLAVLVVDLHHAAARGAADGSRRGAQVLRRGDRRPATSVEP